MRVKFGNHIDHCIRIRHPKDSSILLITTNNSLYTVECGRIGTAERLFYKMLSDGFIDVSYYEYSN